MNCMAAARNRSRRAGGQLRVWRTRGRAGSGEARFSSKKGNRQRDPRVCVMVRAMIATAARAARPGAWPGIWLRLVGAAAARRAVPVWAGVAIAAGVVFGGTGMQAHDATRIARGEPAAGAAMAAMWLVLTAPIGAAMRTAAPGWLRALPGSRATPWIVIAAIALAVQWPWALLWIAGEGPIVGAIATTAAAIAMVVVGGIRWPMRTRAPRWRTAVGALAGVHVRAIVRRRGAALVRALAWAMLAGAMAGMIAVSNDLDDGGLAATLVAAALAVPLGLAGLVAPVVESDLAARWIAGVGRAQQIAAQAVALAAIGAALGLIVAAAGALVAGAVVVDGVLGAAAVGAGLGAIAVRAGAWAAAAPSGFDGTRVVVMLVGATVMTAMAVGAIGLSGALVVGASAVGMMGGLAAPRPR
ncbi:MAG: hypothetical protein K8W52_28365 [Deltaproteobacteria bacterium]|nr:hypothetical protein [Deltaproteobacteria bacterium]